MSTLLSSMDCYMGYNKREDYWEFGCYGDLTDIIDVDRDTIEFNTTYFQSMLRWFTNDLMGTLIKKFEKQYKTTVVAIGLFGTIGTWTGQHMGGKIIDIDDIDDLLRMDVDELEITVDDDTGIIEIQGHHHDGTHYLNLHLITENKIDRAGTEVADSYYTEGVEGLNTAENFEALANISKPLKA